MANAKTVYSLECKSGPALTKLLLGKGCPQLAVNAVDGMIVLIASVADGCPNTADQGH